MMAESRYCKCFLQRIGGFFLEDCLVSNLFSRHYTPLFHFRQINPKLPHCNPKLVIKKKLFLSFPFQLPEQTQSTLHDAISLRGGPSDLAWEFDYKRWQYHINSVADACIAHCISEHHTYSWSKIHRYIRVRRAYPAANYWLSELLFALLLSNARLC